MAALAWVRDEIAGFGGDAGNVTVFGESAGSISVSALLTMPAARGLFHKAILESGSLNMLIDRKTANATAAGILAELHLSPAEAGKLRDLPASDLLQAQIHTTPADGTLAYAPVADGNSIPLAPFEALAGISKRHVPLLIGTNLDEIKLFSMMAPDLATLDEAGLRKHVERLIPGADADGVANAGRAIEVYTAARSARGADVSPQDLWYAIWTDGTFRGGAMRLAALPAATTAQTYAYLFTWKSRALNGALGACHALELPFVFGTLDDPGLGQLAGGGPAAEALSGQMQDAWLAFARTGNPATESLPAWPAYAPPRRATMVLGLECKAEDLPLDAELAFWRSIER